MAIINSKCMQFCFHGSAYLGQWLTVAMTRDKEFYTIYRPTGHPRIPVHVDLEHMEF